jgi:hypothetical protein
MDPSIASSNSLQPHARDSLGRVIQTSPSGQQSVLMVVDESPMMDEGSDSSPARSSRPAYEWNDKMAATETVYPRPAPPRFDFHQWSKVHPQLCSDGITLGYGSWDRLSAAVQEANHFSAERFVRWNEYFAIYADEDDPFSDILEDDSLYYEDDIVFTICPGAVLKSRKGPIFINTESVVIECNGCTLDADHRGSHLSFGSQAKYIVVRGVTFKHAKTSSLVFYQDGAEASFEDCTWIDNKATHHNWGAVADVNSTSVVNFYRCFVGKPVGEKQETASSLSIRQA